MVIGPLKHISEWSSGLEYASQVFKWMDTWIFIHIPIVLHWNTANILNYVVQALLHEQLQICQTNLHHFN